MPTWVAPPLGWIKLNVDVGFDPTTKHAGLDFIARNHLGQVIFSGWCNDRICNPAKEVEIHCTLSVFQGLMCLESDNLGTINALKASSPNFSSNCFVIEEAKRILSMF
jgi:hypothetical protein